ncbi:MAG: hypothetical protein ABI615_01765 [Chthoniobacterales bacterium]
MKKILTSLLLALAVFSAAEVAHAAQYDFTYSTRNASGKLVQHTVTLTPSNYLYLDSSGHLQVANAATFRGFIVTAGSITSSMLASGTSRANLTGGTGALDLSAFTLTMPGFTDPAWLTLTKSKVGLGNVDNTSDAAKNSATATLTNKTLTAPVINSPTGIVKADVGLGNVDNTADAAKPVSTATQTALNLKAPLFGAVFTNPNPGIEQGATSGNFPNLRLGYTGESVGGDIAFTKDNPTNPNGDDPTHDHRTMMLGVNQTFQNGDYTIGTESGSGYKWRWNFESFYGGALQTTITGATAGNPTTITHNNTGSQPTLIVAGAGITIYDSDDTALNGRWIIQSRIDSTHFTINAPSAGTVTTAKVVMPTNEINYTVNGQRLIAATYDSISGVTGHWVFGSPVVTFIPSNWAYWPNQYVHAYDFNISSTGNGRPGIQLKNNNASSANAYFEWYNALAGHVWRAGIDHAATGADNWFLDRDGTNYFSLVGASTSRVLIGNVTDDTSTPVQITGATKLTGNLTHTGSATISGTLGVTGVSTFTGSIAANGGGTATGAWVVTDSSGGAAVTANSTNLPLLAQKTGAANSTASVIQQWQVSAAATPATYTTPLTLQTLLSAGVPNIAQFLAASTCDIKLNAGSASATLHNSNLSAIGFEFSRAFFNDNAIHSNNGDSNHKRSGDLVVTAVNVASGDLTLTTSSATTSTARRHQIYTGSGGNTWTLPVVSGNTAEEFCVKNRGSGDLTIASNSGSQIYDTAAVTSVTVSAGSKARLVNDGTYWNLE